MPKKVAVPARTTRVPEEESATRGPATPNEGGPEILNASNVPPGPEQITPCEVKTPPSVGQPVAPVDTGVGRFKLPAVSITTFPEPVGS